MINKWQDTALRAVTDAQAKLELLPDGLISWALAALASSIILFWHSTFDVETLVPRFVCALALLAALRLVRRTYLGAACLAGIAVILNPFMPGMLTRIFVSGVYLALAAMLLLCLSFLEAVTQAPPLILVKENKPSSSRAA